MHCHPALPALPVGCPERARGHRAPGTPCRKRRRRPGPRATHRDGQRRRPQRRPVTRRRPRQRRLRPGPRPRPRVPVRVCPQAVRGRAGARAGTGTGAAEGPGRGSWALCRGRRGRGSRVGRAGELGGRRAVARAGLVGRWGGGGGRAGEGDGRPHARRGQVHGRGEWSRVKLKDWLRGEFGQDASAKLARWRSRLTACEEGGAGAEEGGSS